VKKAVDELKKNPVTPEVYPKYGTTATLNMTSEVGIFPIRNWQEAYSKETASLLSEPLRDRFNFEDLPCSPGCPVRCTKLNLARERKWEGAFSEGPEYETIYSLEPCCGIFDPAFVIQVDNLCDDYGLDTISTGVTIAFAMECFEKGIFTREETGGAEFRFGYEEPIVQLIRKIANRSGFGKSLALGVREMAKRIGIGTEHFALHVKGMEIGGFHPRGARGMALVYADGPRGRCHHAGGYTVIDELMDSNVNRFPEKGKARLAFNIRNKIRGDMRLCIGLLFCGRIF